MINFVYYSRQREKLGEPRRRSPTHPHPHPHQPPPMVAHHLSVYDLILLFIGTRMEVVGSRLRRNFNYNYVQIVKK